jgi:hypothetical protein
MTPADVDLILHLFDGIFLGGTNRFKSTAPQWAALAKKHGKRWHFARASSLKRIGWAMELGAASADSTQPLWEAPVLDRWAEWFRNGCVRQVELF